MNRGRNLFFTMALLSAAATAQTAAPSKSDVPVRISYINVCSPEPSELAELRDTLLAAPSKPSFAVDMETSRGRSLVKESAQEGSQPTTGGVITDWVRLSRDFPEDSHYMDAQYSLGRAGGQFEETLVLHLRPAKSGVGAALQLILSDQFALSSPYARLAAPAPTRLRLERFGKSSVVLARCKGGDQSSYEPLFARANELMKAYRAALRTSQVAPAELRRLSEEAQPVEKRKTTAAASTSAATKKASKQ